MQKQKVSKAKKSAPKSDDSGAQKNWMIAEQNDYCRRTFSGCKILMTSGVSYNPERELIFKAVREFNNFTKDNDPYGEHDFASFTLNGQIYFWKIDYYDDAYEYFKEKPIPLLCTSRTKTMFIKMCRNGLKTPSVTSPI